MYHNKKNSCTMQCKNTANDLLIIKDLNVFMNNSIKTGKNNFFHMDHCHRWVYSEGNGYAYVSSTLRPVV